MASLLPDMQSEPPRKDEGADGTLLCLSPYCPLASLASWRRKAAAMQETENLKLTACVLGACKDTLLEAQTRLGTHVGLGAREPSLTRQAFRHGCSEITDFLKWVSSRERTWTICVEIITKRSTGELCWHVDSEDLWWGTCIMFVFCKLQSKQKICSNVVLF